MKKQTRIMIAWVLVLMTIVPITAFAADVTSPYGAYSGYFIPYYYYSYGDWSSSTSSNTANSSTSSSATTGWNLDSTGKRYLTAGGTYLTSGWYNIDGYWYYFNANGYAVTSNWVDGYYLQADGTMATSTWIGDRYVGADGKYNPSTTKSSTTAPSAASTSYTGSATMLDGSRLVSGQWLKAKNGRWWFQKSDGSYPVSQWCWIDGNGDGWAECYHFNRNGYMSYGTDIEGYHVNSQGQWVSNGSIQRKYIR